jgi:hypothetical protein
MTDVIDLSKTYFGKLQAHKVAQILKSGILETPDTTPVYVDDKNDDEFVTLCHGDTKPTDTEAGFLKGCRFIDSNTVDGTNPEWINVGDEVSCEFVQLQDSLGMNDAGAPMLNALRVASDVISAETVTIGADVYEVEIVNTDSTDNTANGDFNNTTNPLTVAGAVARYANCTLAEGEIIRVQNEMMRVTDNDGTDVTFKRGVSGTTVATHADALDIFVGDGIVGGSTIAVGLVATLTPTAFMPALVDDINNDGTLNLKASQITVNHLLLESADAPGGTVAASTTAVACSETLTGANNAWANATMVNGKAAGARSVAMFTHTVLQVEEDLALLILSLPFNPTGYIVQAYDANGVFKGTLSDKITISGNRIQYDFFGATNLVATDKVMVVAWN